MSLRQKTKRGFTLLEILLVVGIIAVLAGIVIIAINPGRQLAIVRNAERTSDIKQISNAVQQYYIDNGHYPTSMPTTLMEICDTGTSSPAEGYCGDLADLSALVPAYLPAIPKDPQATTTDGTGYTIMESPSQHVVSAAPAAELGTVIAIGTSTASLPSGPSGPSSPSTPYVWITTDGSNQLSKISTSTGAVVDSLNIGRPQEGVAVAANGNVWITSEANNSVSELSSSTGAVIVTTTVGTYPIGIAIDPSGNVWVANFGTGSGPGIVTKLNGSTGAVMNSYSVGSYPFGIAADSNGYIWVTDEVNNYVYRVNSSGSIISTTTVGTTPMGIAVDSSGNIWTANYSSNNVTKLNSSGVFIANYSVGSHPRGIAVDADENIWVSNAGNVVDFSTVSKLNNSGTLINSFNIGVSPWGVAVDLNDHIWIANQGSDTVSELDSSGTPVRPAIATSHHPYAFGDATGFALQHFVLGL